MNNSAAFAVAMAVWFMALQSIANWDAALSISCLQAGGEFRKEHPGDFFKGRDLCYGRNK